MYENQGICVSNRCSVPASTKPGGPPRISIEDYRFRRLLGETDWARLPRAIRRRFGKRFSSGASVAYQGTVTEMRMNAAGKLLAFLARAIGAPLPYDPSSVNRAAVVVVTEDSATNGQFWIRQYGRANGFPQTVCSSKRFAGPTGLEEYIGYGVGMALRLCATKHALYFLSDGYFISIRNWRFVLPRIVSPGQLVISHEEIDDGTFRFSLKLEHPVFGNMITQSAVFRDADIVGGRNDPLH